MSSTGYLFSRKEGLQQAWRTLQLPLSPPLSYGSIARLLLTTPITALSFLFLSYQQEQLQRIREAWIMEKKKQNQQLPSGKLPYPDFCLLVADNLVLLLKNVHPLICSKSTSVIQVFAFLIFTWQRLDCVDICKTCMSIWKHTAVRGNFHQNCTTDHSRGRRGDKGRKADFIKWEEGNSGEWEIHILKKHEREYFPQCLYFWTERQRFISCPQISSLTLFLLFSTTETRSNWIAYGNSLGEHVIQFYYKGEEKNRRDWLFPFPF